VAYAWKFPYSPNQDFRFAVLLVIPFAYFAVKEEADDFIDLSADKARFLIPNKASGVKGVRRIARGPLPKENDGLDF
jgi:hypothetical protein